ncbi:MAG TPA: hypothetical protein VGF16_02030 [Bryobacteraceae bacterium]
MTPMRENDQLDALFQAYRSACPTPEPGVNFMPQLWRRIEARQNYGFSFRRMANALVTAALAASICLGVYTTVRRSDTAMYSQSYVETLAAASTIDTELVAPARLEIDQAPPVN